MSALEDARAVWFPFSNRYPGWRNRVTPKMVGPVVRLDWWLHDSDVNDEDVREMIQDVVEAFEDDESWRRVDDSARELVRELQKVAQ